MSLLGQFFQVLSFRHFGGRYVLATRSHHFIHREEFQSFEEVRGPAGRFALRGGLGQRGEGGFDQLRRWLGDDLARPGLDGGDDHALIDWICQELDRGDVGAFVLLVDPSTVNKWTWTGVATPKVEQPATLAPAEKEKRPEPIELRLVSADGHAIPEIAFTVRFASGAEVKGRLDKNGRAQVEVSVQDEGAFGVIYHEPDVIRTRALAARAHDAIASGKTIQLLNVLGQPQKTLKKISEAYAQFYGKGKDLIASARDIAAQASGSHDGSAVEYALLAAGIESSDETVFIAAAEPTLEPRRDDIFDSSTTDAESAYA